MYIVVAVVHQIRLEFGAVHFVQLGWHKRQIGCQRVAVLAFAWLWHEIVGWVVVYFLFACLCFAGGCGSVSAQPGFYRLRLSFFPFLLCLFQTPYLGFRPIVVVHYHNVVDGCRNFKTVFVFYQYYVFTLETRYFSSAYFA